MVLLQGDPKQGVVTSCLEGKVAFSLVPGQRETLGVGKVESQCHPFPSISPPQLSLMPKGWGKPTACFPGCSNLPVQPKFQTPNNTQRQVRCL